MKEEVQFIITGMNYYKIFPDEFSIGEILELEHEENNSHDTNAIKIFRKGKLVGYVPNKGASCKNCNSGVKKGSWACKHCGCEELYPGGMATRIVSNKVLENGYHCYVTSITDRNVIVTLLMDVIDEW